MSASSIPPNVRVDNGAAPARPQHRGRRNTPALAPAPVHFAARAPEGESGLHHAELFYLQKQIQSQTPMVVVLEDGEQLEGCIEWYDRNTIKVRGRTKTLVYKSAIKFMYKLGDVGR